MSMDTIAIAVSVLFATAGYLLQCASNALSDECLFCFHDKPFAYSSTAECRDRRAYTARRAEQSAQAQAQEDHIAELARNRSVPVLAIRECPSFASLLRIGCTTRIAIVAGSTNSCWLKLHGLTNG
eukprot:SAG31_NODE_4726_length_3005_cov_6.928424_4_plen_126_part_00